MLRLGIVSQKVIRKMGFDFSLKGFVFYIVEVAPKCKKTKVFWRELVLIQFHIDIHTFMKLYTKYGLRWANICMYTHIDIVITVA